MAVTKEDVEDLSSMGWSQLNDSKKDDLLSIAQEITNGVYSGRIATLGEVEGNREDFEKWVAAHVWELAEGGEAQSESGEGGSVNYNSAAADVEDWLSLTRYGMGAKVYIRYDSKIGMVTT